MATKQEILDAARSLGKLIADHDVTRRLESALKALENDQASQRAMNDYNRQMQAVAEKEAQGKPIEVSDKHKLRELQQAVVSNPLLRNFQMAQMDYVDLLREVDDAMLGEAPQV